MDTNTLERADRTFSSLGREYSFRKRISEKIVHDWRWYTWSSFDIRPLYFERHGWAPGRRLREVPENLHGRVCCGLDAAGRILVEREFNEFGAFKETFYNWDSVPAETVHYDADRMPINILVVTIVAGRPESSLMVAVNGSTWEQYLWDRDLVREVKVEHAERLNGQLGPLEPLHTARVQYDERGRIERLALHWPPKPPKQREEILELMFERRGKSIYRKRT